VEEAVEMPFQWKLEPMLIQLQREVKRQKLANSCSGNIAIFSLLIFLGRYVPWP